MRMLDAHMALLKAELAITGKELGVIAAIGLGAFAVFALAATLFLVGGALFYGEWLYGSMGWGIIHGTLLAGLIIGWAVVNLAGGNTRAYLQGGIAGLLAGAALVALLLSNVGNRIFEWGREFIDERIGTDGLVVSSDTVAAVIGFIVGGLVLGAVSALIALLIGRLRGRDVGYIGQIAAVGFLIGAVLGAFLAVSNLDAPEYTIGSEWFTTILGFLIGALVVGIVAAFAAWRAGLRDAPLRRIVVTAVVIGGILGAIFASTRYEAADGVMGLAIMVGLITWIVAGALLAARLGFDPEARYANIIPRESIAAFEKTKDFMTEQWESQKNRMLGR